MLEKTPRPPMENSAISHAVPERTPFGQFARRVALVVAVVLVLWLVGAAAQAFLILFLSILAAIFFRAISSPLARRTPLPGRWAVVVTLVALAGVLGAVVALSAPGLEAQFRELGQTLPAAFSRLQTQMVRFEWGRTAMEAADSAGDYLPAPEVMVRQVAGVFSTTLGAVSVLLVILFFGICLALEPSTYRRGLLALVPIPRRQRVGEVLDETHRMLARWLMAILISMTVVGVLTGLGLWLLGIPLVFVLAFLAFLLAFIPNVGPILAAAPAILIAFSISPQKALHVTLLYIGIQTVESYLVTPLIERKTVSLPPALTGVVQLVLALFTGLLGIIVAAPLTAAAIVLIRRFYVGDVLGDHPPDEPSREPETREDLRT